MYDMIIVGAGPAGATLARLVGRERSVLLVEARNIRSAAGGQYREKCCGGLLAPDAQAMLTRFGLELPDWVRDSGQPLVVRALDLLSGRSRRYPRPYVNMERPAFERWLLSLLPDRVELGEGIRFISASRLGERGRGEGWTVRLRRGDTEYIEHCRLLVGADGADSAVRRLTGPPPRAASRYLAVQDVFEREALSGIAPGEYLAFFHPEVTDFYGWAIPKRERTLLGVALPCNRKPGVSTPALFQTIRQSLEHHGLAFGPQRERQACLVLRPSPGDIFLGCDGAFCIGEAAGCISPSSAEGFSYAFRSAQALTAAMRENDAPDQILAAYGRKMRTLRLNLALKNMKAHVMFSPLLRDLIMRSGVLSAKDACV